MPISTINQAGLNAPLTLTSPVLNSPAITGTPTGTLVSANMPVGCVLQVVQGSTTSATSTNSGSLVPTSLSATITPKSATSKILILMTNSLYIARGSNTDGGSGVAIYRNGTQVFADAGFYYNFYYSSSSVGNIRTRTPLNYLDSPASTAALTYTLYIACYPSSGSSVALNVDGQYSFITLMEVAA